MGSGDAAMFYAIQPGDNAATVAPGFRVEFPQNGANTGTDIERRNATAFQLNTAGTYRVTFSVPIDEAGQLVVAIDGIEQASTLVGRSTGTTSISGTVLLHVNAGSRIDIQNPQLAFSALTVSTFAGGPTSTATLLIELVKAD